jgi:DNA polymerase-4
MTASVMKVQVRSLGDEGWERSARFNAAQDTLQLAGVLRKLWNERPASASEPLAVGVTLSGLASLAHRPQDLFDGERARGRLDRSVDELNRRYGKNTIYYGGAHLALRAAPMRIAFTHIPDPVTEGER